MRVRFFLFILVICSLISGCNFSTASTPTRPATVPTILPTTLVPSPAAATSVPQQLPLVYYYFVTPPTGSHPAGSVVILKDTLILGPALSKIPRSADPVVNLAKALEVMIQDTRNAWKSSNLKVVKVMLGQGAAAVDLQGEIQAPGDVVMIAARMQILFTVFAEPAVQTALVTLNGQNIANLGISHSSEAKPTGFAYTRAEIEAFLKANLLP